VSREQDSSVLEGPQGSREASDHALVLVYQKCVEASRQVDGVRAHGKRAALRDERVADGASDLVLFR
jgi:hypothetical protein